MHATHVLALLDCDTGNAWHWLHAQLLHCLSALLLWLALLATLAGASLALLILCINTPAQASACMQDRE